VKSACFTFAVACPKTGENLFVGPSNGPGTVRKNLSGRRKVYAAQAHTARRSRPTLEKKSFSQEQIVATERLVEGGTSVAAACRKLGITEQTFCRWKRKFAGMGVTEVRRLKQLEDENKRLKALDADLTLDKHMLQEAITKRSVWRGPHHSSVNSYATAYRDGLIVSAQRNAGSLACAAPLQDTDDCPISFDIIQRAAAL
jgi:putative transposase